MARQERYRSDRPATPYLLLLPFGLLMLLFFVCIANIVKQSIGLVPGYEQEPTLAAYAYVLTNEATLSSIYTSFYIAVASTVPSIVLGTLLAWCIVSVGREGSIGAVSGRLVFQIPHTIACVLVVNMFLPSGMLPRVLEAIGFSDAGAAFRQFLYMPNCFGVIIEYVWKETGYICFMLMPVMSGISNRLGQAAANMGASTFKGFLHVVLPHCMPSVRTMAIIVFVYTFGAYETPFLLGNATVKALPVLAYAEYGLTNMALHRPIAMALNMVLIALSIVTSLIYYFWGVRKEREMGRDQ